MMPSVSLLKLTAVNIGIAVSWRVRRGTETIGSAISGQIRKY